MDDMGIHLKGTKMKTEPEPILPLSSSEALSPHVLLTP